MKRWVSPYINHFISADTVTASYANPQSLNRYSYVLNNPLRYTDPTGHRACGDGEDIDCNGHKQDPNQDPHLLKKQHKDKHDDGPNWGKYIAGGMVIVAGEITMIIGGAVMLSAYGEIVAGAAAAPPTFGLSEVIALIHAPAELAVGGLIFSGGVGLTIFGGKTVLDSGVPKMVFNKLSSLFK